MPARKISIGILIIALLLVQGSALGLKAWEEQQTNTRTFLETLQRTSLAAKERIDGKVETILTALNSTPTDGDALSALADTLPDIEIAATLTQAAGAEPGSRLRIAAERVLRDGAESGPLFVSELGDIIILSRQGAGPGTLALAKGETWLPAAAGGYRFALTGLGAISRGNADLTALTDQLSPGAPQIKKADGSPRAGLACSSLTYSTASICALHAKPLIEQTSILQGLIYLLLLIAPALAIYGLYRMLSDQTKQLKSALKTEREATHLIDLTMDGAQAGFWESRSDRNDIQISMQLARLLGQTNGGVITLNDFVRLAHVDDRDGLRTAFERANDVRQINALFRAAHNGGKVWIEISGREVKDHDGNHIHFAGIAANITERKDVADRLKMAERRLRNALEGYNGPFAIWDARKRLLYWNGAFARTFNLESDLREGMGYDTVSIARAAAIRQETPYDTEPNASLLHLVSGRWVKLVERVTPEGGLITVGIDVTETTLSTNELNRQKQKLKRLVAELERSEGHAAELARKYAEEKERAERAAHSKSAFLANMSHELRTPLNAINGFSEILSGELYGPLGDPRYKGYADDILMSGQHLLDMINDILDMAKIEAGKMSIQRQILDPVEPVDAAIRMIRRKAEDAGINLIFDFEDNLPEIGADHRAIRQMVLNLLSNAIKFTDRGGRIGVTLRAQDNFIRVAVTDNGIGIPVDALPRLGRPFEQVADTSDRNYEGTGLGLALTKSFAEMHGGKLTIKSQQGRGTTVAFYLPIDAKDSLSETPPHAAE